MDQLATLSEEARELALGRFRWLQPHIENGTSLRLVAEDAGIPFRTAQRWVGLYHEFGLVGLSRKHRTDKGEPRAVSVQLREAIEGLALQRPPLPISVICRQVRRLAKDTGEAPPSYWVVYRTVSLLPLDLVTLAHEGSKAYGESFELIHRREAEGPNAIWQADHTPLDILVLRADGRPPVTFTGTRFEVRLGRSTTCHIYWDMVRSASRTLDQTLERPGQRREGHPDHISNGPPL